MKSDNSGLLIAALVAIVAVVGLVILFKGGGATGAALCPDGFSAKPVSNVGGQAGYINCVPNGVQNMYPQSQRPLVGDGNSHYYHIWK